MFKWLAYQEDNRNVLYLYVTMNGRTEKVGKLEYKKDIWIYTDYYDDDSYMYPFYEGNISDEEEIRKKVIYNFIKYYNINIDIQTWMFFLNN